MRVFQSRVCRGLILHTEAAPAVRPHIARGLAGFHQKTQRTLNLFFFSRGQILEVWEQSRWLHVRCEDACGELLDLITLAQERLRREYRLVRVVQYVCASLWSTFTTPIYLSNKEEVQIFGATGNHIQNALQAF